MKGSWLWANYPLFCEVTLGFWCGYVAASLQIYDCWKTHCLSVHACCPTCCTFLSHCVLYVRVPTPVPVWYCTWVTLELHVRGTLGEVRQVPYYLTGNYSHNSHILRLLCIIVVPFIHLHHYLWFLAFVVVVFQNHCFQKSIHVLILSSRLFRLE